MSIINNTKVQNILFLDIETVSCYARLSDAPKIYQDFWIKKSKQLSVKNELNPSELYQLKSAIYSEFSRVVCVSCAIVDTRDPAKVQIRMKTFSDLNEKKILTDFYELIKEKFANVEHCYCGHNIREFDFPFLARRAIINEVSLPDKWQTYGKKPWEVGFLLDTLDMWKFGDYKKYISLDLMHYLLCGSSAKQLMDGSMVHDLFWDKEDLKSIVEYCEEDVRALIRVYLALRNRLADGVDDKIELEN